MWKDLGVGVEEGAMSPPLPLESTSYSPVSDLSAHRSLFDRPAGRPLDTGIPNCPVPPQQAASLAAKAAVLPEV